MDPQTLGFALAAGLVAALNPCGFSMLPAYLALVVVGDGEQRGRGAAVGRALGATAVMALGFLVVFGTFGLLIAPLTSSVQQYLPAVTVLIGAAMVGLGIWMLTGRELTVVLPKLRRGAPTAQLSSMFGYGLAYAIASLSCTIGPFLAVTSTTFRSGSILGGVLAYLAYGAGMTIVVGCWRPRWRWPAPRSQAGPGGCFPISTGSPAGCSCWSGATWATTAATSYGCTSAAVTPVTRSSGRRVSSSKRWRVGWTRSECCRCW